MNEPRLRVGAPAVVLWLLSGLVAAPALGGPLDADDRAKVAQIDAEADRQIGVAADANTDLDGLVVAAELANEEIGILRDLTTASLELDLQRMLLETCALPCANKPVLPGSPPAQAQRCWSCASPRLMIPAALGGYLDSVLGLVEKSVEMVVAVGLSLDVTRAEQLLGQAREAFDAGRNEESFGFACQAFATLACDKLKNLQGEQP